METNIYNFINGIFQKHPKIPAFSRVEEMCPILGITNQNETMTKGGKYAVVIELSGKDYTGLDSAQMQSLDHGRKTFFEKIPSSITVLSQTHRTRSKTKAKKYSKKTIKIADEITQKWNENFHTTYRSNHYLIFITDPGNVADQLDQLFAKKDENGSKISNRILSDVVHETLVKFKDYGARILTEDELTSYWGWLVNGRKVFVKMPGNRLLDGIINGTTLRWKKGVSYQEYEGLEKKYSGWLSIKQPAEHSSNDLITDLLKVRRELSIYQSFSRVEKNASIRVIEDKVKNAAMFVKAPEIILNEMSELAQRLQADELSMLRHRLSIEVFGETTEKLEDAIREVQNTVESWGYMTTREKINQEALFWSRFPETHDFNPRQRMITSENACSFVTFATVGEGLERCSWGNEPVTIFETQTGSQFGFTFHSTPEKNATGNTLVIGGTGSGKTTTISFLLSQCFRYENFRVLAFDRLRGMEIFSRFHDGEYLDFVEGIQINPLQIDDTGENRAFLNQWFQILTGKTGEEDQDTIGQAVQKAFNLPKKERTLENIADAFGLSEKGSVRKSLNKWLPGEAYESFFNGKKDALNFQKSLVALDMTTILDTPEILGPMAFYLFHKLFAGARDDGGYAVFVDELGKYLKSETFAPKIEMLLQEIRKTDGVFIGAIQDAGTVLDHEIAAKIKNNIATYLLFPEPRADERHYIEELGLNETEFAWIKGPHPRELLIKRREGESVVVNVDLSPLGKYLKIFDSGASSIRKINKMRKENPNDEWKEKYLHN